jgi:hypothetical protein
MYIVNQGQLLNFLRGITNIPVTAIKFLKVLPNSRNKEKRGAGQLG